MRDRVDGEVKVIKGEVLAIIGMFLEDHSESLEGEDGLEYAEIFGEKQEGLDVESFARDRGRVFSAWLVICSVVVVINF